MNLAEMNSHIIDEYSKKLNISKILLSTLINRGFNIELISDMINSPHKLIEDPRKLTNAEEAANMIYKHIQNNSFIFIFGDYDVDGLTSGYVMQKAIEECKKDIRISTYFPNRSEGYGINMNWVNLLIKSQKEYNIDPKNILVITVDNGITQVDEINKLIDTNIDVLITDHHNSQDEIPNTLIVNPYNHHEEQSEDTKHLSGCGVVFKIAQILQEKYNKYNMLNYTPYVAMSTIADVMPMSLENIALIKYGLMIINSDKCPSNIQVFKDYTNKQQMNSKDISFEISPKLNACGRINEINRARDFLFNECSEKEDELFLRVVEADNIKKEIEQEAISNIDLSNLTEEDKVVVSIIDDIPEGMLGLIANKVARQTKLPSIMLTKTGDELIGSARSINNINLLKPVLNIIEEDDTIVNNIGGHDMAFGINVKNDKISQFKKMLNNRIDEEDIIQTERVIDYKIEFEDINMDIVNEITTLIPFNNQDLLPPLVALEDVEVKKIRKSKNNKENICFTLKNGFSEFEIWGWGFSSKYKQMGSPKFINIYGELERNFMNPRFATMKIIDISVGDSNGKLD